MRARAIAVVLRQPVAGVASIERCHQGVAVGLGENRGGADAGDARIPADDGLDAAVAEADRAGAGQQLPSIMMCVGRTGSASSARRIASSVACRILRQSISSWSAQPTAQASARSRMSGASTARRSAGQLLGIAQAADAAAADRGSPPRPPPGRPAARGRPHRRRPPRSGRVPHAFTGLTPSLRAADAHSASIASAARAAPAAAQLRMDGDRTRCCRSRASRRVLEHAARSARAESAGVHRAPAGTPAPARVRRAGSAAKSTAPAPAAALRSSNAVSGADAIGHHHRAAAQQRLEGRGAGGDERGIGGRQRRCAWPSSSDRRRRRRLRASCALELPRARRAAMGAMNCSAGRRCGAAAPRRRETARRGAHLAEAAAGQQRHDAVASGGDAERARARRARSARERDLVGQRMADELRRAPRGCA